MKVFNRMFTGHSRRMKQFPTKVTGHTSHQTVKQEKHARCVQKYIPSACRAFPHMWLDIPICPMVRADLKILALTKII